MRIFIQYEVFLLKFLLIVATCHVQLPGLTFIKKTIYNNTKLFFLIKNKLRMPASA